MTNEGKYHQKFNILNYNEQVEAVKNVCQVTQNIKMHDSTVMTLKGDKDDIVAIAISCLTKKKSSNMHNQCT